MSMLVNPPVFAGSDSRMVHLSLPFRLLANHAASATDGLSLAQCGGFHRPHRFRCGFGATHARSKGRDLRSDRNVRTPWRAASSAYKDSCEQVFATGRLQVINPVPMLRLNSRALFG